MDSLFDADLIAEVARQRPDWMMHLLGAVDPEPHRPSIEARLGAFSNVIFHGAVPHAELPAYASAFDVALAPFPDSALTRGRDPIKVYEYLAAHRPVAAAHAPQLADLPYVQVASSPEAFVRAIQVSAQTQIDPPKLDRFLAQQTWAARGRALDELLRGLPETPQRASSAPLPSFARPDAAAVMRYAQALERELEEVQAWAHALETQAQARGRLARVRRLVPVRRAKL
jgi:hypothetical protein